MVQQNIKIMNREELKRLWFSLPRVKKLVDMKVIKVERHGDNHYSVERITDVDGYYASSNSNYNSAEEAMEKAMIMKNDEYYTGYKLIIQ